MRIVVNHCYGGFSVSHEAYLRLRELGSKVALKERDGKDGKPRGGYMEAFCYDIERTDPLLLQVMDELGSDQASGALAELEVVEIPDGVDWEIDDYDGMESVEEKHRRW
jgi:hypothetical protein